jgi:hypothetical protein
VVAPLVAPLVALAAAMNDDLRRADELVAADDMGARAPGSPGSIRPG